MDDRQRLEEIRQVLAGRNQPGVKIAEAEALMDAIKDKDLKRQALDRIQSYIADRLPGELRAARQD